MENFLDILPVGVWVLDQNFRVVEINSTIEDFFGIHREDVLGKDKRRLVKEVIFKIFENGEEFRKRVLATYDSNTYIEHFIFHVLPSECRQQRWLEHTSQPIQNGAFQGGRVEVYMDVTERVLAEQEIHWLANQTMQLQEKEKSRIASYLHDELGQSIMAIRFSLEHLYQSLEKQPNTLKEQMDELGKTITWINKLGHDVSTISSNIMPSMLNSLGLEETLAWLKDQYSSMYGLDIYYQSLGISGRRLDNDLEVAIFRVFQEGLNNIVKHASAQHVHLKLVYSHPKIIATITDDGKGFNSDDKFSLGTGLRIMKQRILELNGTIKIKSKMNFGTTIRVEFPSMEKQHDKI